MKIFLITAAVFASVACDDSLMKAIEAVQRRQRDLSSSPVYYSRPYIVEDGQPEDIGYGYQKTIAPSTAGLFEPIALPYSELGSHDYEDKSGEARALEKLIVDYFEDGGTLPKGHRLNGLSASKRSIFRERDDAVIPDSIQQLYEEDLAKSEEEGPIFIPSSFRERMFDSQRSRLQNARMPMRNYGGLNRDIEDRYEFDPDENDEYLNILNSLWEKYKDEDPEELTDVDLEGVLQYLNGKNERKRQYSGPYGTGYDFFNSPNPWSKRSQKKENKEVVRDYDEALGQKKRYYQDGAFDDRYPYRGIQKRFPITKRSPSPFENYDLHHRKKSTDSKMRTDPKVAEELNNIFSAEKNNTVKTNRTVATAHATTKPVNKSGSPIGQKEESTDTMTAKPLDIKKKSINMSDYFGIDRRKKKSLGSETNDEWLLNQYLKAYGMKKAMDESESYSSVQANEQMQTKRPDDMDTKLRAMEDLIVDQAIKYTGAHEGTTDSKEVQEVKEKVMAQLAAAYSLEKMRRALGEFKSSIAAQRMSDPSSHPVSKPSSAKEEKRISVKKEKAEARGKMAKKDKDNKIVNAIKEAENDFPKEESMDCPIWREIEQQCRQVGAMAGDLNEVFLPLCSLHQICYLCGPEVGATSNRGCDLNFLSEARAVCHDDLACYYAARKTLNILRSQRGDMPAVCDWQTHPCLARFLAASILRRR